MRIERVVVYQPFIFEAVLGARLSWASGSRSDSTLVWSEMDGRTEPQLVLGEADTALVTKLLVGASGEDKFLRAIPVSMWITAPLKWWHDFDTYTFAVTQSESLMHYTKGKGELPREKFSQATSDDVLKVVNDLFRKWIESGARMNSTSPDWEAFQDSIPRGFLYTKHVMLNYATLRLIYKQRRNHRQGDWREFCKFVEGMPHGWMITQTR